jgi:hypothetical protein
VLWNGFEAEVLLEARSENVHTELGKVGPIGDKSAVFFSGWHGSFFVGWRWIEAASNPGRLGFDLPKRLRLFSCDVYDQIRPTISIASIQALADH